MKKIKVFKNGLDFDSYIKENKSMFIASGKEGEVYLSHNNEIIKYMKESYEPKYISESKDIIMADNLQLDSFIFPKELFALGDQIVGYREDYFPGNVIKNRDGKIEDIDIDALMIAREIFIEDLKLLTTSGYNLYDLSGNLLFDNKRLVAIDTLDYEKVNPSLKDNIKSLDNALVNELRIHDLSTGIGFFDDLEEAVQKIRRRN